MSAKGLPIWRRISIGEIVRAQVIRRRVLTARAAFEVIYAQDEVDGGER